MMNECLPKIVHISRMKKEISKENVSLRLVTKAYVINSGLGLLGKRSGMEFW